MIEESVLVWDALQSLLVEEVWMRIMRIQRCANDGQFCVSFFSDKSCTNLSITQGRKAQFVWANAKFESNRGVRGSAAHNHCATSRLNKLRRKCRTKKKNEYEAMASHSRLQKRHTQLFFSNWKSHQHVIKLYQPKSMKILNVSWWS